MKQVRFEFEELPYDTLSQFGLSQEMIEDLPMHALEEISHGRHSPVLPIKVKTRTETALPTAAFSPLCGKRAER